ncbi:MAG: hypothetical protein II007_08300 [Gammaproteobacteria bacterium]|nr:hypothetical protein [Gammaproteobacteria bacterium]
MVRAVAVFSIFCCVSVQAVPIIGSEHVYRGTFSATVASVWGDSLLDLGVTESSLLTGTFDIGPSHAPCGSGMNMNFAVLDTTVSTSHWADPCPSADQFVTAALPEATSDLFMPRGIYVVREEFGSDSHNLGVSWLNFSLPSRAVDRTGHGWEWQWNSSLEGRVSGGFEYRQEGFDEWGEELVEASGLSFIINFIEIEYRPEVTTVPAPASALLMVPLLLWLARRRADKR